MHCLIGFLIRTYKQKYLRAISIAFINEAPPDNSLTYLITLSPDYHLVFFSVPSFFFNSPMNEVVQSPTVRRSVVSTGFINYCVFVVISIWVPHNGGFSLIEVNHSEDIMHDRKRLAVQK